MSCKSLALLGMLTLLNFSDAYAVEVRPANPFQLGGLLADAESDVRRLISESLGSIEETYRGIHKSFPELPFNLEKMGTALTDNVLNPFVQGLVHGNPLCWMILVALGLALIGFFQRCGARLCDAMLKRSPPRDSATTQPSTK